MANIILNGAMFVSVVCDIASIDHRSAVFEYLNMYGFSSVLENVFESTRISENNLLRLKKDIDNVTDSYDKIRFYQYPVENTLVISSLEEKRWRRSVIKHETD